MAVTVTINSAVEKAKIKNFWNNIHFHPTDAVEDMWGRNILDNVAKDGIAECVRLYAMLEDIVSKDGDGKLVYDFSLTDKRLDYMVSRGFDLLICFVFTPMCIASDKLCVSKFLRYKGKRINTSTPCDYGSWEDICREYTRHLLERYGKKRLSRWYFHCWNEPDLELFWMTGCEDADVRVKEYCKLYDAFARGVRSVSVDVKIGGPSIGHRKEFLTAFLRHIKATEDDIPRKFDFLSIHTYGSSPHDAEKTNLLTPESLLQLYAEYRSIADGEGFPGIEIVNDEWGVCSHGFYNEDEFKCLAFRNTERFSAYYFAMIDLYIKNNVDISKMMICLSGQHGLKKDFEGYRSFFTLSGYKKPIYNAYAAAAMLGDTLIECEHDSSLGVIPTKDTDGNIVTALYYTDPRLSFTPENKLVRLKIYLPEGKYRSVHYRIDRDNCNSYSEWCKCGRPQCADQSERERVMSAGELAPWYTDDSVYFGEYTCDIVMTPNSVSLVKLIREG